MQFQKLRPRVWFRLGLHFYEFAFARQVGPRTIYFAALHRRAAPPLSEVAMSSADEQVVFDFDVLEGQYGPWDSLDELRAGMDASVIPECVHIGDRRLVSANVPIPMQQFLISLPPLEEKEAEAKAASSSSARNLPKAWREQYPWMVKPLPAASILCRAPPEEVEEDIDILDRQLDSGSDDEEIFFSGLHDKEKSWAAMGVGSGSGSFRITMRKGRFTKAKTGRDFDTCQCKYSDQDVYVFCKDHGLPTQAGWATLLFEEHGAIMMARTWQSKMTYFYDLWLSQDRTVYRFTEEDVRGWEEPRSFTLGASWWTDKQMVTRVKEIRDLRPRAHE